MLCQQAGKAAGQGSAQILLGYWIRANVSDVQFRHLTLKYRIIIVLHAYSTTFEPISANKNLVEKNKRWISQKDESKDIVKKMINIKVIFTFYIC